MQSDQYYRRLTRNMLITVILVSFAPLLLILGIIGYKFETSYREKVVAQLKELVQKHEQTVDTFLHERLRNIAVLAETYQFEEISDEGLLERALAHLRSVYGAVFVDLGVVNEQGLQMSYAGPFKLERADYSNSSWFKEAVQSDYYISDVFLGLRKQPHFIVAARRESGGRKWILRATIDFVAFNTLVESVHIGKTGSAFILNGAGEFQTTPNLDRLVNQDFFQELLSRPGSTPAPKQRGPSPNGTAVSVGSQVTVGEAHNAGRHILYLMLPLKGGDWVLAYQQDAPDAFSDLLEARILTIAIASTGAIAIVMMAILLSKRMVHYIERADREKEILNERVIEAGKLAAVGELAAGIAHEINNPVAIMVEEAGWMEDLIAEEDLQKSRNLEEFRTSLQQIRTQGERCKQITHKLLSFARSTDPRKRTVRLNELIEELISISEQRSRFGNIKFATHLASDLPEICASPSEIQQVLLNLINNAVDAIGPEGGTVEVTTRVEGPNVIIDIVDTGHGIPQSVMARIFDPFFTTKPVGKGTGLGLSICYGIVKKMGGDITANSTVNVGTAFHVQLPLPAADEQTCV